MRKDQILILDQINDNDLVIKKSTAWGEKSLEFVVMKTLQHSLEHGNIIMRHLLFWDMNLEFARKTVDDLLEKGEVVNPEIKNLLNQGK